MKEPTFDMYRVGYVSELYDVSDNAAKALQLFELGLTHSGVAKALGVNESTAKDYRHTLESAICERVTETVTQSKPRFDVYGQRQVGDYGELGHADGVADAAARDSVQVTDSEDQLDPEFRERQLPLNKGCDLSEIPSELVYIKA